MGGNCCTGQSQVMLLCCSGGSNVGQLSNQAAVELTQEGKGRLYCLAGIGAKLSGFVRSAMDAPLVLVIDGCEVGCAKAVMENAGIPLKHYLTVTGLGIEKDHDFKLKREDLELVKAEALKVLEGKGILEISAKGAGSSCCS